jgi:hypothetical protein
MDPEEWGASVGNRRHRELPLPCSFNAERHEHWLVRHEREIEEQQDLLNKRLMEETAKPVGTRHVQPDRT